MWLFLTATLVIFAFALFQFPRQTLYVLGGLVAIIVAGGLYLYADQKRWDQENEKKQAQEANVLVWVVYDPKLCPAEFPLLLTISNLSSSVVNSVEWSYKAFAPGRSTNLVRWPYGDSNSSDRILQPGTKITLCYKVPELSEKIDPGTLAWSAQRANVDFAGG